jgi:hypothetical protein
MWSIFFGFQTKEFFGFCFFGHFFLSKFEIFRKMFENSKIIEFVTVYITKMLILDFFCYCKKIDDFANFETFCAPNANKMVKIIIWGAPNGNF